MAAIIKNIPFIGGSTMTFEFDLGTKVDGSVAECPMKLYANRTNSLQSPSNITGNETTGWNEIHGGFGGQSFINMIKTLDGTWASYTPNTSGQISQLMVELDLTTLCNNLFGGSTSAMKTALKSIITNIYAKGSGVNNGTQVNSCSVKIWSNANAIWNLYGSNTTSSISNISYTENNNGDRINATTNKLYFLVCSDYPSNGTIVSEVDLDYVNIKLQFARVPDVINLLSVTLPSTWSMLIKGFSPYWNTSDLGSGYIKYLLGINQSQNSNYDVSYQNGKFVFDNWDGSTAENLWSDSISLTRFQTVNLLIEQTSSGRRMRILQNNGQVLKYSISSSRNFPGTKQMGVLMHTAGQYQADAFLNSMIFLPNKNFDDDTEAEAVLRGTADGFEPDELVTDSTFQNGLTSYPDHGNNISVSPGKTIFTTMSSWINQFVPVLPNNKYVLDIEGTCANGITEYYNGISLGPYRNGTQLTFTTGPHTNRILISMYPTVAGQYITSVSLKLKM